MYHELSKLEAQEEYKIKIIYAYKIRVAQRGKEVNWDEFICSTILTDTLNAWS